MTKMVVFRLATVGDYAANNVLYPTRAKANAALKRFQGKYPLRHVRVVQRTLNPVGGR